MDFSNFFWCTFFLPFLYFLGVWWCLHLRFPSNCKFLFILVFWCFPYMLVLFLLNFIFSKFSLLSVLPFQSLILLLNPGSIFVKFEWGYTFSFVANVFIWYTDTHIYIYIHIIRGIDIILIKLPWPENPWLVDLESLMCGMNWWPISRISVSEFWGCWFYLLW